MVPPCPAICKSGEHVPYGVGASVSFIKYLEHSKQRGADKLTRKASNFALQSVEIDRRIAAPCNSDCIIAQSFVTAT